MTARIGPGKLYAVVNDVHVLIGFAVSEAIVAGRGDVVIGSISDAVGKLTFDIDEGTLKSLILAAKPDVTVSYPYDSGKPRRRGKGERKKNRHNRW